MTSAHLRYLLLEQGIGAALFNLAINATIAWLLYRHLAMVPLWGQQGIAGDTIGTCFFLPFFTGLIVTRLARGRIRAGKLAPLGWTRESHPSLDWLPRGTVRRAVALGVLCAVLIALPTVFLLSLLEVTNLRLWTFVTLKATFAALLAAVVTPVIGLWAIADLDGL